MALRTNHKDNLTEHLLRKIEKEVPGVRETTDADALLGALSLQSTLHPERRVWLETDADDGFPVDLENWNDETEWDNAVARVKVNTLDEVVTLVKTWLSGGNLDGYENVNKQYEFVTLKS
jgi:hypothetical protein